jgi:hypothetical protein
MTAALRRRPQPDANDAPDPTTGEVPQASSAFPIEERDGRMIINPRGRVVVEIFTHEADNEFTYLVRHNGKVVVAENRGLPTWERAFIYAAGKMLEHGLVELPRRFSSSITRVTAVDLDDRKLASIKKLRGRSYTLLGAVLRDDEDKPRRWQAVGDNCPEDDLFWDTPMEALLSMVSHLITIGTWK